MIGENDRRKCLRMIGENDRRICPIIRSVIFRFFFDSIDTFVHHSSTYIIMFRSLTAVRPAAARAASMQQARAFSTAHHTPVKVWDVDPEITKPLSQEEQNQRDHAEFEVAKIGAYAMGSIVFGLLVVKYWYGRELDHFKHHRHQQEPYAFFIKRDGVAAGFWPGRKCQFLEFNCYAAAYDAADHLLAEKHGEKHE